MIITVTFVGGLLLFCIVYIILDIAAPVKQIRVRIVNKGSSSVHDHEENDDVSVYTVACNFIDSKKPQKVHYLNCSWYFYRSLKVGKIYTLKVHIRSVRGIQTNRPPKSSKKKKHT